MTFHDGQDTPGLPDALEALTAVGTAIDMIGRKHDDKQVTAWLVAARGRIIDASRALQVAIDMLGQSDGQSDAADVARNRNAHYHTDTKGYPQGFIAWCACGVGSQPCTTKVLARFALKPHLASPGCMGCLELNPRGPRHAIDCHMRED